ncbi:MAG: restriction endonuclease subunit S [Comamonadaceae bacterium]|nr:MAG: restriction endonuclease subunit S [Comamonadaceae bacterium]
MRQKKLSELLDISIGRTPSRIEPSYWGDGHRWVSIRDLSSKIITETKEQITDLAVNEARCKVVKKGTLLFSFKLTIGKMAFAGCDLFTNEAIAAFRIKDEKELSPEFLYYALRSVTYGGSNQAVMGKTLNSKSLADIEIPLPPLDDQIRVAHLLGKVEGLIAQRKQHLQQLDDLLKSVFVEMFGDPVRNEKGWQTAPLEQLGSINRGVSKHRPRNDSKLLGGPHPLIQTGEVSNAGTYITAYTQTYSDLGFAQSKLWPAGTLCITIAANIAQTGILTFDACFPDSVVGFLAHKNESNTLYVHGLFWFFQAILEKNAPAAAQKNINLEILRGLVVPKPPIELQDKFAELVKKVEAIRSRYQQSLRELGALYSALSQKAFKGELDLSRVFMPKVPRPMSNEMNNIQPPPREAAVISLPATDQLLAALNDRQKLESLLGFWLQAYTEQLGDGAFSVDDFIRAAESRADESLPDREFELGTEAYDLIKAWVFDALRAGRMEQVYPNSDDDIRVVLRKPRTVAEG